MERLSPADYLDDPLTAHPRYSKIKYLNEGTFGVVVLAQDVRIKAPVRCLLSADASRCVLSATSGIGCAWATMLRGVSSTPWLGFLLSLCSNTLRGPIACLTQLLTRPTEHQQHCKLVVSLTKACCGVCR